MNIISKIKFEDSLICRICLVQAEDTKNMNLNVFEYCIGINITETPHSTQICGPCESSLNDFSIFKEKCINSHESLIKMYSDNRNNDIDSSSFKTEPFENSDEEMLENDELVTVFVVCEEDEIPTDCSADEISTNDISESESTTSEATSTDNKPKKLTKRTDDSYERTSMKGMNDLDTHKMSDISESETSTDKNRKKSTKTRKRKSNKKPFNYLERVICPHCGKTYNISYISTHIRNSHSNALSGEEQFKCDVCKNTYKNKESFTCHKRKHTDLVYACKICDKPFKNWGTRRCHMVSAHDAPYRYNCNMCDYKTNSSSANSTHIRQHSGELPFECEDCKKKFISQSSLTSHMITHSNEKNFFCEYCNKAFGGLKHLRAHLKIHTQERNYVCPAESCGKSFIQNHVLKSHMKANHPDVEIPPSGTIVSKKYKNVTAIQK